MFLTVVILLCSWQILIDINIKFSRRWKIASSICYLNSYNNMWSILRYIWTPWFLEEAQSVIGLGLNIANPKSKSGLSHLWREQIFTLRVWQVLGGKNILRQSLQLTIFNKEQSIDKSRNLKDTVLVLGFFLSFHCSKFWRKFMEVKVTISAVLCLCW